MRKTLYFVCIPLLFALLPFSTQGAAYAPLIKQFSKRDYSAQSQNWSITQDEKGYIWVGNTGGVLQYNGQGWRLYTLPGRKTARTVYASIDGRIYTGAYQEFGYFEAGTDGVYDYTSLSDSVPEIKERNEEIWSIIKLPDGKLCFQSFSSYYLYNGHSLSKHTFESTSLFLRVMAGSVYSFVSERGWCRWNLAETTFELIPEAPFKKHVVEVISLNEGRWLIVTAHEGLFIFDGIRYQRLNTEIESFLTRTNVNRAVLTPQNILILGSIAQGVVAITQEGKLVWELNDKNGLINNTILALLCDKQGNCWVGMDNGLAYVYSTKPMTILRRFSPPIGMVYDVSLKNNRFYMGTNQGLFYFEAPFKGRFESLTPVREPALLGQVWNITATGDEHIVGYNSSTALLSDGKTTTLSAQGGGYCFTSAQLYNREVAFQGHYSGIALYEKDKNNRWQYIGQLEGYRNPTRFIEVDHRGRLWCSHPVRGISMITLSPELDRIADIKQYSRMSERSSQKMNLFKLEGRVVICDYDRIYTYDDIEDRFVPLISINNTLGAFAESHRIVTAGGSDYWFITGGKALLAKVEQDSCSIIDMIDYKWFDADVVDNFEQIKYLGNNISAFCLDNAVAFYNHKDDTRVRKRAVPSVNIDRVLCFHSGQKEEARNLPVVGIDNRPITLHESNLLFYVDIPEGPIASDLKINYLLSGETTQEATLLPGLFECNHLSPGNYQLQISLMDNDRRVGQSIFYSFEILPPWYLTWWAKMLMLLSLAAIVFIIYHRVKIQNRRALERKEEEMSRQLAAQQEELTRVENELLQEKLKQKTKEVASTSLSLLSKNTLLDRLLTEIEAQHKEMGSKFPHRLYDKLIKLVQENRTPQKDWELFKTNFDRVHEDFYQRLHAKFPMLTSSELRLCAYINLNIPTKEIARILDVSPKAIEISRYRIRKKLDISADKTLLDFILEL